VRGLISKAAFRCSLKQSRVEPGYNVFGLSDTSSIALDVLWYQLHSSVTKTLLYNHPARLKVRLYAIEFATVRCHKSIINISKIQSNTTQLMIFTRMYSYIVLSTK
jgi:hypothetical protein